MYFQTYSLSEEITKGIDKAERLGALIENKTLLDHSPSMDTPFEFRLGEKKKKRSSHSSRHGDDKNPPPHHVKPCGGCLEVAVTFPTGSGDEPTNQYSH